MGWKGPAGHIVSAALVYNKCFTKCRYMMFGEACQYKHEENMHKV